MAWQQNISIEFFPPQTDVGVEKMLEASQELSCLKPTYLSVTYGAGGSTQLRTLGAVDALLERKFLVAPHLSCIGATKQSVCDLLDYYKKAGIHCIVALRGDLPSGMVSSGDFSYAIDLVQFIRDQHGSQFRIKVAAYPEVHPQALSYDEDVRRFCKKMDAGADEAITQYFYNSDAYGFFVEACRKLGMDKPIVPGIMPITNADRLIQFSDACGADIPRWLRLKLGCLKQQSNEDLQAFADDVVAGLCEKLIAAGAPGLHFYAMNRAAPVLSICRRLGLTVNG